MFKDVSPTVNFPEIDKRILRFWRETRAFEKRVALNKGKPKWSFIDGPITANNPMGVHHAWGRTYKDLFQRYKAMSGHELRYQNGFDCQGLWIEVEVEKELGFKSKRDIERYGIANFVKKCKQRALRFAAIQVEQSIKLGYWMDWDDPKFLRFLAEKLENPMEVITVNGPKGPVTDTVEGIVGRLGSPEIGGSYFTLSDENNYMIWAVLKKCYERGWIYKGTDVMPWCPRCSTALSQHEIVTEGYREITHPALTLRFPLRDRSGKESLLVWTTTPWTLTSNVSAAVHPEVTYVKVKYGNEVFYLAKATLPKVLPKGKYEILGELLGREMEGWRYEGPYDDLPEPKKAGVREAHRVILWEDVSEEEGTGIVHIAPGCGKEDLELGRRYGLPAVAPLNDFGVFKEGFGWLTGMHVYDSAKPIIEDLQKRGFLLKVEDYRHRYPVCWRCGSELVFRLVDEWFISMGKKLNKPLEELSEEEKRQNLRYQIMESAKQVRWIPAYGLQHELNWLENMEDWMISKKRFWGLALPIWECSKCGNFEVIGSKEELKERAVEGWEKFEGHSPHRPWVDAVKIRCRKCGALMSRIPDVGNPWLDAGIVAYSTLRYRHDREYWRQWFPAEMVCECLPGQFRNWFYAMLAMSTILEGCAPFKVCFGHGLVLDEHGREMHKSWGNVIWFDEAVEKMGADVLRWMYCTNKPETNLLMGYGKAEEIKRRFLIPLWNIYSFFVTYANIDRWTPKDSTEELTLLDRWILSKLQVLIKNVTRHLENYEPYEASTKIEKFVEELSTWYIRRSRRRFWKSETDVDKRAAYTTLYRCITTLIKLLAPFLPFITEEIYQNLVRSVYPDAPESVHHNDWPKPEENLIDEELMRDMELTMKVCSLGRSARSKAGIKLRQPLAMVKVAADRAILKRLERFKNLIKEELNVKAISLTNRMEEIVRYRVKPKPEVLGKRFGRLFSKIKSAMEELSQSEAERLREGLPIELKVDGRRVQVQLEDVEVETVSKEGYAVAEESGLFVGVDIRLTEELKMEGLARDIVRRIQNQRKAAGFEIADEIEMYYEAGPRLTKVFERFGDYIAAETLSIAMHNRSPPEGTHVAEYILDGEKMRIGLALASKS